MRLCESVRIVPTHTHAQRIHVRQCAPTFSAGRCSAVAQENPQSAVLSNVSLLNGRQPPANRGVAANRGQYERRQLVESGNSERTNRQRNTVFSSLFFFSPVDAGVDALRRHRIESDFE